MNYNSDFGGTNLHKINFWTESGTSSSGDDIINMSPSWYFIRMGPFDPKHNTRFKKGSNWMLLSGDTALLLTRSS